MKRRIVGKYYLRRTTLGAMPFSLPNMPAGKTLEDAFSGISQFQFGFQGIWNYPNPHPNFPGPPKTYVSYSPQSGFPEIYLRVFDVNGNALGPQTRLVTGRFSLAGGYTLSTIPTLFYNPTDISPGFFTYRDWQFRCEGTQLPALSGTIDTDSPTMVLGSQYFLRRWTITTTDRWTDGQIIWENVTTEKHYQFLRTATFPPHIAFNLQWTTADGLEHSIVEATRRTIVLRHFVMASQQRQYTVGASGMKRPLLQNESSNGWKFAINEDINQKAWNFGQVSYPTISYNNFGPRWLPDFFSDVDSADSEQLATLIPVGLHGTFNNLAGSSLAAQQSCLQRVVNRHLLRYQINPQYQAFTPRWVGYDIPAPTTYYTHPDTAIDYKLSNPNTIAQWLNDQLTEQPFHPGQFVALNDSTAVFAPTKPITTKTTTFEVEHDVTRTIAWNSSLPVSIAPLGNAHTWRIANSTLDGQPVQFAAVVSNWLGPIGYAGGTNPPAGTMVEAAGFNTKPSGQAQTYTSINGQPVPMTLSGSDSDSSKAMFIIETLPMYPDFPVSNDETLLSQVALPNNQYSNQVTWYPPQGWHGTTNFTYRVFDGFSFSDPIVVTLIA